MKLKTNENNGLVVMPRWYWCVLSIRRFLWLIPASLCVYSAYITGLRIVPALSRSDISLAGWSFFLAFISLVFARYYVGRCFPALECQ